MEFEPLAKDNKKWSVKLIYEGCGYAGEYNPIKDDTGVQDSPILKMIIYTKDKKDLVLKCETDTYLFATDDRVLLDKAMSLVLDVLSKYVPDEYERFFYQNLGYIHLRGKAPSLKIEYEKAGCDKK